MPSLPFFLGTVTMAHFKAVGEVIGAMTWPQERVEVLPEQDVQAIPVHRGVHRETCLLLHRKLLNICYRINSIKRRRWKQNYQ